MTAPTTLEELHTKYHGMVLSLARKSGISESDIDDAAQNIEERFWRHGGLTWYDPDRLHERPPEGWRDGSTLKQKKATFGTMYRSYVARSMLGEAERLSNERKRHGYPVDWTNPESYAEAVSGDVADTVCNQAEFVAWLEDSCNKLRAHGWADYVQLFKYVTEVALSGHSTTKEEIIPLIGPKVTVSKALTTLQQAVKQAGIKPYGKQ